MIARPPGCRGPTPDQRGGTLRTSRTRRRGRTPSPPPPQPDRPQLIADSFSGRRRPSAGRRRSGRDAPAFAQTLTNPSYQTAGRMSPSETRETSGTRSRPSLERPPLRRGSDNEAKVVALSAPGLLRPNAGGGGTRLAPAHRPTSDVHRPTPNVGPSGTPPPAPAPEHGESPAPAPGTRRGAPPPDATADNRRRQTTTVPSGRSPVARDNQRGIRGR